MVKRSKLLSVLLVEQCLQLHWWDVDQVMKLGMVAIIYLLEKIH